MKKRLAIYLIVLLAGIGIFLYKYPFDNPSLRKVFPGYCNQFSGFASVAFEDEKNACEEAGCKVVKVRNIERSPFDLDYGVFTFKCRPK